ncbi:MAG: hypothetical protein LUE64_02055 [Candidatus Gastranaerophilales bacterium]|nr:hypothetical protein [Candidatus Gastranaerophilales bacterium]
MSVNSISETYYYQLQNCSSGTIFADSGDCSIFAVENIEEDDDEMNVIAHRGYTVNAPENTIAAFEQAAENGYDTVECDIQWTKDGVPVILHDSTINRTARKENGSKLFFRKKCSNMTYEELLKYDFGSYYSEEYKGTKIPTFYETLECIDENDLNLYAELKEGSDFDIEKAEILAQAVEEMGLEDNITWISFNADYLEIMSEVMPNSRLGYLTKKTPDDETIETLNSLKTDTNEVFLDIKSSKITKNSAALLEEAGFEFEVWTVDDTEELDELEDMGCSGITTNELTGDEVEEYLD